MQSILLGELRRAKEGHIVRYPLTFPHGLRSRGGAARLTSGPQLTNLSPTHPPFSPSPLSPLAAGVPGAVPWRRAARNRAPPPAAGGAAAPQQRLLRTQGLAAAAPQLSAARPGSAAAGAPSRRRSRSPSPQRRRPGAARRGAPPAMELSLRLLLASCLSLGAAGEFDRR